MSLGEAIAAEFEHENANTRKALERIPEDRFDWTPHPKSWTFAQLASHLAEMPQWVGAIVDSDEFVMPEDYEPFVAKSSEELLEAFDKGCAAALEAIKGCSDEQMMQMWRMKVEGKTVMEMPRVAVIRSTLINHAAHHRGQLTVYLRLNDVPVPAIYGPSADEAGF